MCTEVRYREDRYCARTAHAHRHGVSLLLDRVESLQISGIVDRSEDSIAFSTLAGFMLSRPLTGIRGSAQGRHADTQNPLPSRLPALRTPPAIDTRSLSPTRPNPPL